MIYSAGDLGIEIDFGSVKPGAILQRKEKGYWQDYLVDEKPDLISVLFVNTQTRESPQPG